MPGRFTNGPEPQPSEEDRIRNKLFVADIFDFSIRKLSNNTIEVIVSESADESVITALGAGEFKKTA